MPSSVYNRSSLNDIERNHPREGRRPQERIYGNLSDTGYYEPFLGFNGSRIAAEMYNALRATGFKFDYGRELDSNPLFTKNGLWTDFYIPRGRIVIQVMSLWWASRQQQFRKSTVFRLGLLSAFGYSVYVWIPERDGSALSWLYQTFPARVSHVVRQELREQAPRPFNTYSTVRTTNFREVASSARKNSVLEQIRPGSGGVK